MITKFVILVLIILYTLIIVILHKINVNNSKIEVHSHETCLCLSGPVPECRDSQWAHPGSGAASSPGCPTADTWFWPRLKSHLWKPAPGATLRHDLCSRAPVHLCVWTIIMYTLKEIYFLKYELLIKAQAMAKYDLCDQFWKGKRMWGIKRWYLCFSYKNFDDFELSITSLSVL